MTATAKITTDITINHEGARSFTANEGDALAPAGTGGGGETARRGQFSSTPISVPPRQAMRA